MRQFLFTFVVFTLFMIGFLLSLRFSHYKNHHSEKDSDDENCATCSDGECATCAVIPGSKLTPRQ